MGYQKITVNADNEEKAKKAFIPMLKKLEVSMGQVVNFSVVERNESDYDPEKTKYKIIYNDGVVSE